MNDPRTLLGDAALRLSIAGVESPRLDARLLLAHALSMAPDALVGSVDISEEARARFEEFLARRILREPVAYITGHREFWSLDFEVGPGVLVPRPETETLVEQALDRFPDRSAPLSIVDFGTGTGCLLVALLHEFPNARGVGVEASRKALSWAEKNLEKHHLAGRASLHQGSWKDLLDEGADVIVSNPPYIRHEEIALLPPEIRLHEPVQALDGGPDGLEAYRTLAPAIRHALTQKGWAFLEIGKGQDAEVGAILAGEGLTVRMIVPDLAGIGRCVVATRGAGQ